MDLVYTTAKFVHVTAVIVWLGGQVAIAVLNARMARAHDATQMAPLTRASRFFGTAVAGPAAGLTLVAGIVMMASAELSFGVLWIAWGLGALVLSMLLGATVMRRAGEQLATAMGEGGSGAHGRIEALQGRLRTLGMLNLLVLFSAVWAMVAKPTL